MNERKERVYVQISSQRLFVFAAEDCSPVSSLGHHYFLMLWDRWTTEHA